jgi:signal transduction histidine kinase/ligand-binding sensor domain-containing protein
MGHLPQFAYHCILMKFKVFILFFLIPLLYYGQHRFSHINIEDGLTENSVTDIFQDSEGFLWFATQDGISQYDGYNFKNYTVSNNETTSLSDNYLWGLTEDSLGFIWACSRNGLNRINKNTRSCTQFLTDTAGLNEVNQITDVAYFQGSIFVNAGGIVYQIPVKSNYPNRINLFEEKDIIKSDTTVVYAIHINDDEVYFLQEEGLFNYTKKQLTSIPNFNEGVSHNFLKTTQINNNIWLTNGQHLFTFNTKTKATTSFYYDFNGATIYDLLEAENELWVATDKGVFIFNGSVLVEHLIKDNGISSNYTSALGRDKTGKIWIGTSGNGLNIYNPKHNQFKFLSKELLGEDYIVRSAVQTKNNELIVCTSNKLLALELKTQSFTNRSFANNNVKSIHELKIRGISNIVPSKIIVGFNGDILIGTKGDDIIVLDENLQFKKRVILNKEQRITNVVSDIILTQKNEFWIATYYGVYVLDENYNLSESFLPNTNGLTTNYFLSVFEDTENQIWLGSNKGIYQYISKSKSFKNYPYQKNNLEKSPGFNFVCGFADFGDGYLWMATYGGGLSKMNKEKGTFNHFTTEEGLSNNVCNGLLSDQNNNIWINTNKGISKFNPKTEKFLNYTKSDGLHFNEFNLNSFYKNNSGEFFFGTPIGMVIFNPNDIKATDYYPPIIISAIDVNYKNENQRLLSNQIELYPEDKVITIHFAGLNFSDSPKIKYKYQLKGYDDDWVETNELKANYTSLPDGEFTFLVNVTNQDGVWNETPKEITVIVHPPIYKTWWFVTLSVFVILVLVILIIRYFAQRNIKKRLRELRVQQEIHQEKQRISRDLHDNIGAQITYLISSIDQEAYGAEKEQAVFDQLSDKARNVMTQLRQTIWLISKEAISLSDFAQKVRDYSTRILSAASINSSVQVSGEEFTILTPTIVSHLFRIIQEAQNNIIKHAKASEVKIEVGIQNNALTVTIQDDGIGIGQVEKLDDHFGLKNMKDRITEIQGSFRIENNNGTRITIEVPL